MKYTGNKTVKLNLRLGALLMAKIDTMAKDEGLTRSEKIRNILEESVQPIGEAQNDAVKIVQADGKAILVGHGRIA